jgi:hypothetical protein
MRRDYRVKAAMCTVDYFGIIRVAMPESESPCSLRENGEHGIWSLQGTDPGMSPFKLHVMARLHGLGVAARPQAGT